MATLPPPPMYAASNSPAWLDWFTTIARLIESSEAISHVHANQTILDAIEVAFTTALNAKLAGIEAGAEVNNISDANATDLTDGGETTLHSHPGGAGAVWTSAEINAGTKPVYDIKATIVDAGIAPTDKIIVTPDATAPAGRTADDWQWDGASLAGVAGTGQFTLYATFHPGPIVGKRNILYQVA
jgi:hypothetical protein